VAQVDSNGVPQRARFTALGSGSYDAIAVLESIRSKIWKSYKSSRWIKSVSNSSGNSDNLNLMHGASALEDHFIEDVSVQDAIPAVRQAVRAGIMNDLGSGSHVDIVAVTADEVRSWRESMVSSWETENKKRNDEFLASQHISTAGSEGSNCSGNLENIGRLLNEKEPSNVKIIIGGVDVDTVDFFHNTGDVDVKNI
jgi:hypothetical protein